MANNPFPEETTPPAPAPWSDDRESPEAGETSPSGPKGRPRRRVRERSPKHIADLIAVIKETADKLTADGTSRGDVKILARTIRELRYAFKVFSQYRKTRKVTVFGSARTPPDAPAYRQAVRFSSMMADRGWMVVTGAARGIMEAGHEGAGRDNSMGLNIMLPFEQRANPIIAGDYKLVHMKYFFTRKLMFVKESNAICLLPGGFGTLDEGLEVLTLMQTGKRDTVPVVFLDEPGGSYWSHFQEFVQQHLLGGGMISPDDLSLYKLTDNAEEAVEEILGFFRVYHSMRYVHEKLVLRLTEAPSSRRLAEIHRGFGDLLSEGKFTVSGPLREERDETDLAALPRLVFAFNRHNYGRLRQLIDFLNTPETS